MNSMAPHSRTSIIYDADHSDRTVIIAQPKIAFSRSTTYKELHLTTIVHKDGKKMRAGVRCLGFRLIDPYQLAGQTRVQAVCLNYEPPVEETNIRSAYRLSLASRYRINGKIHYGDAEYTSPRDFTFRDISMNGTGLLVSKTDSRQLVSGLRPNDEMRIDLILIDQETKNILGTVTVNTEVRRINPRYSDRHLLLGLQIVNLSRQDEAILNRFIHEAQMDELKKSSGKLR